MARGHWPVAHPEPEKNGARQAQNSNTRKRFRTRKCRLKVISVAAEKKGGREWQRRDSVRARSVQARTQLWSHFRSRYRSTSYWVTHPSSPYIHRALRHRFIVTLQKNPTQSLYRFSFVTGGSCSSFARASIPSSKVATAPDLTNSFLGSLLGLGSIAVVVVFRLLWIFTASIKICQLQLCVLFGLATDLAHSRLSRRVLQRLEIGWSLDWMVIIVIGCRFRY